KNYAQNQKWLYYANDPPHLNAVFLQFQLEIETWALWILSQKWNYEAHFSGVGPSGDAYTAYYWQTEDGFNLDEVMKALAELAGEELRINPTFQPKALPAGPKNPGGTIQEIDPEVDQDEASAKELSAAAKHVDDKKDLDTILNWAKANP